ncbi:hypothetical protein LDENG_00092020 [Lucifuga dentata]|nr:hypothetical protein LDENG_00092020 [Lucifuga dentata]
MAGETQRTYAVKELDAESKLQNEGTALEQQSDKTTKESSEHFLNAGTEAIASSRGAKAEKLEKERDCTQQREAVIRPQQAGKIDFRSLQNRSKFASDRTWPSGKGSPQSPSGKGRSREKGKRSGKTERGNPQQLYRLSITNPRSNPTIGIAYPQQKVPPPKKLETSRGPVSGSYRFHVPSIPEREAELQQEELGYTRCFQEASSNLTSPSYTSQALGSSSGSSSHPHPSLSQQQQPASMETNNTHPGSQLLLADFQLSGSNAWQSPERNFNGANYGVSSQKPTALADANKASAFVPGPFQYGYQFLEESTSDSFPCEQNPQSQDFTDSSLGSVHVTHNSFSFTSVEGQNISQNSTQFSNEQQPEDRNSYPCPPQSQFIQGAAPSIHCSRSLSEDSASNDSSGSGSQQSDQGKSALPESTETFAQTEARDTAINSGSLNKNGELIPDSETKADNKDDPMKLGLFSGPGNLPVPFPELEMEDAKLDSLITEALNGLGYQSDNAEIDSSFIDAFADDDLTTVKATSNKQALKTKEALAFDSKNKQAANDKTLTQGKYFYDSDVESPETEGKLEKIPLNIEQDEKINLKKEVSHKSSRIPSREKTREQDSKVKEARKLCKREDENTNTPRFLLSSKFSEHSGVKSFQDSSALRGSTVSQASTSPTSRSAVKESKRKRTGGGTWSKELIHKIVQQKNKLHKLHVKGTKNLQFSLVMERLTPTVQNPAFGEYDYVSDSDDECEPVKIASQGRLNQSSRCKYTYTKECKWRARSERDQAAWRHESKECFEVTKSEEVSLSPDKSHQRLRRRGSRSSTSSELSTSVSVSSDINSPKSTDRTDSDSEKKTDIKKRESPEQKSFERSSPQKLCKESSTVSLTFTKSLKKVNMDEPILPDNKDSTETPKDCHSNPGVADPTSSSEKARDTVKNFEKCRSSHTKSRERLVSSSKESSDRNILQSTTSMCPKEESTQCTDIKSLQFDSHCPTINKETDCNNDRNTKGKRRNSGGSQATKLSDSTTFEKQSNGVCIVKEAVTLVNDLNPKSASLCTSLMDEVCLSPAETHGPLIQKDTPHLMPYPLDQEQGLMKSPLSFDTSSMFGDLTGFDSGLYSDMPMQKEGFSSIDSTVDKKEEFVSSFSPFLEQRDWGLMVDVSPVLPDEISQYKGNSEKTNENKPNYNSVPLSLPEKIIDYSANLNSCASEDELEIKRIVNELENQLQTTKLESPPLIAHDVPKQLQMSKFSPLRLGDESENEGNGLDMQCSVQTLNVPVTNIPSEHFTEPGLPWSSPFQFELLSGHHSSNTSNHNEPGALEHFTEKEHDPPNMMSTVSHIEQAKLHNEQKSEGENAKKGNHIETKEEILEQKMYAENLMKSLEVISDSIFKKEPIMSEHQEQSVTSLKRQHHQKIECQADDAEKGDHREKEEITTKENILSPPNSNERKDDIEFILNESQSSLSNSTDSTVIGTQPILLQPSEPMKNNDNMTKISAISAEEDITKTSNLIESAQCSDMVMHGPHMVEDTCEDRNAEGNVNQNNTSSPEHFITDRQKEVEAVEGVNDQSGSHMTPSALPETSLGIGGKIEDVMKTTMEQQSTEIRVIFENFGSSHPGELKVDHSDSEREEGEITVEAAKHENCSPSKTSSASPTANISVEIVTTEKPCSPILENNAESSSQSMEEQSNLLILSHSGSIPDDDTCKVIPLDDSLKTETTLTFDTIQKEEEILNVKDIKEHLPIHFMASHQNSPCRDEEEESHSLFLDTCPPTSPIFSASHQTPTEKLDIQEDPSQLQDKCKNMSADLRSKSPRNFKDNYNVTEALNNDEHLNTTAGMEYSLKSPPHLDLGIMECKLHEAQATIPSPLPVSNAAESLEESQGLEKKDSVFDFKLSPLNCSSISDEPPQLNQYDYIPISPAGKPEEKPHIKQSPRDDGEPCDHSIDPVLIFNKTETAIDTTISLNSDPEAKLSLPDVPLDRNNIQDKLCQG